MIFRQITHDDLGCASYLIGDETAGVAAVVDPGLGIDRYLELARYMGATIEHVFETHNHLQRCGAREVIHVVGGGVGTWEQLGKTLVQGQSERS